MMADRDRDKLGLIPLFLECVNAGDALFGLLLDLIIDSTESNLVFQDKSITWENVSLRHIGSSQRSKHHSPHSAPLGEDEGNCPIPSP